MASIFDLFVAIQGDNSGYKKAMRESQDATTAFEKTAVAAASRLGDAFAALGLKLSAVGIGALILKAGEDFEKAQAKIGRATGDTGKALDGLSESFKNVYVHSGRSAAEIADAIAKVRVETKLQGAELEALTSTNLKFAKVTGSDVAQSIDQTQVLFQNWGLATADQSEALDVLYFMMTKAGMSASDLSSQMTALGPLAREFGLTFTQTAALVGMFDDAGLKASDMVRGLNKVFAEAVKAKKDPIAAFAELVEKLRDVKTYAEAAQKLMAAGIPSKSVAEVADAAKRGAFNFQQYAKEAEGAKGKVDDVAKATKTFGEEWSKLQHQLEIAASPTGNFLVKWAADSIEKLNTMASLLPGVLRTAVNVLAIKNPLFAGFYRPFEDPQQPAVSTGGLSKPAPGGGAPPATLDPKEIKQAFSDLGIKDLRGDLREALEAFNKLKAAGKLSEAWQIEQATKHINDLRGQIAELAAGWKELPRSTSEILKDLGIDLKQEQFALLQKMGAALTDLAARVQGFVGPQQRAGLMDGKLTEAWQRYAHAVATADDELKKGIDSVPWLEFAKAIDHVDTAFSEHFSRTSLYVKTEADLNQELREQNNLLRSMPEAFRPLRDVVMDAFGAIKGLAEAYHFFGEKTPMELESFADAAEKQFKIIREKAGDDALATRKAWEEAFRARVQFQLATGKITRHESTQILGELDEKGLNGYGKKIKDIERDTHHFFGSMSRGIMDAVKQWHGFADGISSVFKRMGESLFDIIFNRLMKPVEDFFSDVIVELFSKTAKEAATTKAATSALNAATVASDAAVASAATFASIAAIPIIGPAMAPAAAAASYAQVMAMAPLAMFEKGGDVPYDMPAFLHKKEMVLPADIATGMRKIIANGNGGQANSAPPVQFVNCSFGQGSMNQVVRQLRLAGARI